MVSKKESRSVSQVQKDIQHYGLTLNLKRELRRVQNKEAARRSREKRAKLVQRLKDEIEVLKKQNAELTELIEELTPPPLSGSNWESSGLIFNSFF